MPTGLSKDQEHNLSRAQGGDADAMNSLRRDFLPIVKTVVKDLKPKGGDTEDLIAVGMLGAWQAIQRYDPSRNRTLATLIYRCVKNKVFLEIKTRQRDKHTILTNATILDWDQSEGSHALVDPLPTPEQIILSQMNYERLLQVARASLTHLELQIILAIAEGCTMREAATRINRSFKSVDNCLQRIRRNKGSYLNAHTN